LDATKRAWIHVVLYGNNDAAMGSSAQSSTHRLGAWLLVVAMVGGTLAMGAIDPRVLLVVVLMLAAAAVLLWRDKPRPVHSSATVVLVVAVALTAFTLLQTIPLPTAWLGALSPHAADVWRRSLHPFHETGPARATLSLDPQATRVEIVRGIAYTLAFLGAVAAPSRTLQRALIVTSALVLFVAGVHYALDLKAVYGIYRPRTDVTTISPFLNGNHLAAFGNIGMVLSYASLVSSRPLAARPLLAVVVVIAVASDMFWASRGAVASALVGLGVVTLYAFRQRARTLVHVAVPLLVALAGGAMMMLGASAYVLKELVDADVSKLQIALRVFSAMAPAYPMFGAGRGAFESTFAEFRSGAGFLVWTHPENLVAEWVSGWGVPVALSSLVALGFALRPTIVRRHTVGVWATIVVVALQNLVDFSMEIPAMTIALAVCAGVVCADGRYRDASPRWATRSRVAVAAVAMALVAIACVAIRSPDLLADRETLQEALRAKRPFADVKELARDATRRHPAEPYFAYAVAVAAGRSGENVVPWVDHVLERAPDYPPAHLVLARWLRRRAPPQARLEYRLYAEQNGGQPLDVPEVESLVGGLEDALELAPSGKQGVQLLEPLAVRLRARLPATAVRIDETIRARDASAKGPTLRAADSAIANLDEPWCDGPCVDEALHAADSARRAAPDECVGYIAIAHVLAARHDTDQALATLRAARSTTSDRVQCDRAWAEIALEANRQADATAAIDALTTEPCVDAECVSNLLLGVALEERRGGKNRAAVQLKRAASLTDDDGSLESIAQSFSRLGLHVDAARMYERLLTRHPGDARLSALFHSESTAALQP
jgi:hypothetical protein